MIKQKTHRIAPLLAKILFVYFLFELPPKLISWELTLIHTSYMLVQLTLIICINAVKALKQTAPAF
jgi:hypothetical protein